MRVRLHEPTFGEEEIQAVVEVMRSTQVTSGEKVREFERCFDVNAVMCNSGSSANLLAIAALCNPMTENGLRPGDEVIVSALSWSTTVWPLVQHGLVPVIVDIDPITLNIDPAQVEQAIGPRTRAVMPVHVYGNPCDMEQLNAAVCEERHLWLIEDCCEALGAEWHGKPIGGFSDISTFSFYFSHHITTLEGGLVQTENPDIADLIRVLRAHGWVRDLNKYSRLRDTALGDHQDIDPRFLFVNAGYNLRCTEMQAAMGLVQLPKLEGFLERRRLAALWFLKAFGRYGQWLAVQGRTAGARSSWFGFPIIVRENAPFKIADLREYFESHGIETRSIICGNIARQPGMKLWPHRVVGDLKHADHVMRNGFSIGCHQDMTAEACGYVGGKLDDFMAAYD